MYYLTYSYLQQTSCFHATDTSLKHFGPSQKLTSLCTMQGEMSCTVHNGANGPDTAHLQCRARVEELLGQVIG